MTKGQSNWMSIVYWVSKTIFTIQLRDHTKKTHTQFKESHIIRQKNPWQWPTNLGVSEVKPKHQSKLPRSKCFQFRFHLWNTNLRGLILLVQGQYKILSQISTDFLFKSVTCFSPHTLTFKLSLTHMTYPRVCSVHEILVPSVPDTFKLVTYS